MSATSVDYTFRPIMNDSPALLTLEDIDHFNEQGYITPLPLFSEQEVEANRRYVDSLFAQLKDGDGYSINCYQSRCEGIWDLCTTPKILDYVEDLIGPNVICWASHFFSKMPFDKKSVPWHQDAVYWNLTPSKTVTVWLAIDSADEENSAMEFMPKTHKGGLLKWRKPQGEVVDVLDREIVGLPNTENAVSNNLQAGEVSLHADMLAHGSRANLSGRRRCGLTIRYCSPDVKFTDKLWAEGLEPIICRGHDATGAWKHHERPVGNDVSRENAPDNLGGN